jgi:hypothetical protein
MEPCSGEWGFFFYARTEKIPRGTAWWSPQVSKKRETWTAGGESDWKIPRGLEPWNPTLTSQKRDVRMGHPLLTLGLQVVHLWLLVEAPA